MRTKCLVRTLKKYNIVLKSSTKMENIRDIKKHLRQEDYALIGKITGYAPEYIKNCIDHRRNNQLIVQAALSMVKVEEAMIA